MLYVKAEEDSGYLGSYHIICSSDTATMLRIYNYYPSDYIVYVSTNLDGSGEELCEGVIINVDVPASEIA